MNNFKSYLSRALILAVRFMVWLPQSSQVIEATGTFPSRRIAKATCTVWVLIALTLAQFLLATGAQAQVKHTIIAASGDTAPAGGTYLSFNTFALNERGQVAFDAFLGGPSTSGVFVSDRTTTSAIALGGNPDPAAGNFSFLTAPSITSRGDVIFYTDTAILRGDVRTTVPLMQNGDAAPGGGSLILSSIGVSNSRGEIVYGANVSRGVSSQGIFRNDGIHTIAIASDDTVAPTGGTFVFFASPVINQEGQVAFFAGTAGGSGDFGIYRSDGDNTTNIFVTNQTAPGGATFIDFSNPVMNKYGQVLATASLQNGANPSGLFLGDGIHTVPVALSGEAGPKGGRYATFFGPLLLNDNSQAAFEVSLTGGASRSGIFRWDGVITTPIALQGAAAAGTTGTFDSFRDIKMGKDGRVAFIGALTLGVGGVNTTNNIGIWVGTSDSDLHLLARTGQAIAGKTLTRPLSLGELAIDERSLVWLGRFSVNSTAIVSSDLDDQFDH